MLTVLKIKEFNILAYTILTCRIVNRRLTSDLFDSREVKSKYLKRYFILTNAGSSAHINLTVECERFLSHFNE